LRNAELIAGVDRDRRADHPGVGSLRDRPDIRDVVEVRMADKDRIGLLDLAGHDAGRAAARALFEIGVEQDHLVAEGELVIRGRKPTQHDGVLVARHRPAHGGRDEALAGIGPDGLCVGGRRE
jgi:hypothetical protein